MDLQPLFGRIFVESVKEEPNQNGFIIPFTGRRDRGRIINAGDSKTFKVGDLIIYDMRAVRLLKINHKEYMSLEEKDILCKCIEGEDSNV